MPRSTANIGLVLSEIIISLGLLAIVGLTFVGIFSHLAITTNTSGIHAAASLLADRLIERAVSAGPNIPSGGQAWGIGTTEQQREIQISDSEVPVVYTYKLTPHLVEKASLGRLYHLKVDVSWMQENAVERGRGHLQRSRLVYIEGL